MNREALAALRRAVEHLKNASEAANNSFVECGNDSLTNLELDALDDITYGAKQLAEALLARYTESNGEPADDEEEGAR